MTTLNNTKNDTLIAGKAAKITNEDVLNTRYEVAGNNTRGQYIFANTDVSYDLIIGDTKIAILYQNGHSYDYGDYNCPTNDFELYDETVIGRIYRNSGEFNEDELAEVVNELSEIGLDGFDEAEVMGLYELLVNERPSLQSLSIETDMSKFIYTIDAGEGKTEDKEYDDLSSLDIIIDVNLDD